MTESTHALRDYAVALRANQWTKNAIVFAAFFFAFFDRSRQVPLSVADLLYVIPAVCLFCIVSSGIYVFNDIRDLEEDRHHPLKQFRPIARGRISVPRARLMAAVLLGGGLLGAVLLSRPFAAVLGTYVLVQVVYNLGLKRVPLIDILVIAGGFVLRAIAGAVVLHDVTISPWLLLCTFLLALFLALCKRRHEKISLTDEAGPQRASLAGYDTGLLDQLIAITSAATIVSYAIYTLWPQTVDKFGTSGLGFTVPFVVFGIFRYLDLAYRHRKGDRPEKILLTDLPLLVDLALYALTIVIVIHLAA